MRFSCVVIIKDKVISIASEQKYDSAKAFEKAVKAEIMKKYQAFVGDSVIRVQGIKVI